nr:hypothetical protein [Tanacetum cinerariifolium]
MIKITKQNGYDTRFTMVLITDIFSITRLLYWWIQGSYDPDPTLRSQSDFTIPIRLYDLDLAKKKTILGSVWFVDEFMIKIWF